MAARACEQHSSSLNMYIMNVVARDRVVNIATRCGLDGPGIESQWGLDFPHCPDQPWG